MLDRQGQIFGYWGNGSVNNKVKIVQSSLPHWREIKSNLSACVSWSIYTHSPIKIDDLLSPTIRLSASGISQDAWIRISDRGSRLTLGREQFGKFPLYWLWQGKVVYFASHLSLLSPLLDRQEIDLAGLYSYTCFSYIATPHTPLTNISAITAGTELSFSCDQTNHSISPPVTNQVHQWQQLEPEIDNEKHAIEQLQTLLINAVNSQIQDLNQEPVGVLLSGGLDSSIVAALLVKAGLKVRGYTLDFGQYGIPEYPYAQQVAHHLHIPLVTVDAGPQRIKTALIPTIRALDLPFGDGVTVPLYLLCQAASQEVKTIFNGEGGDQLFAGWTNKPLIAATIYQTDAEFTRQYLHTFHRLWGYEQQIFQPEIYRQITSFHPTDWIQPAIDPQYTRSMLHRLRRATLMLKGAQNIHPRATNLALAQGLQVRSLFADLPLAEFTFQLSGALTLKAACEKYILKKTVVDWLPPEIVWRTKRGMGVPLTSWCQHPFWHDLGNWLNPAQLAQGGLWQTDLATRIISSKLGGNIQGRRIGEILWLMIVWELWQREFLGEREVKLNFNHPFWLPKILGKFSLEHFTPEKLQGFLR
jgi:asparagine synthase (glutamine-hydrolysing)